MPFVPPALCARPPNVPNLTVPPRANFCDLMIATCAIVATPAAIAPAALLVASALITAKAPCTIASLTAKSCRCFAAFFSSTSFLASNSFCSFSCAALLPCAASIFFLYSSSSAVTAVSFWLSIRFFSMSSTAPAIDFVASKAKSICSCLRCLSSSSAFFRASFSFSISVFVACKLASDKLALSFSNSSFVSS